MHIEKMTMRAIVKHLRGHLLERYKEDDAKLGELDRILGAVEAEVKAIASVQASKRSNKKKTSLTRSRSATARG